MDSMIDRAAQTATDLLNQVEGLRGAWLLASQAHSPAMWEGLTALQRKNVVKDVKVKEDAYMSARKLLISTAPSLLSAMNGSDDHFEIRVQLESILYVEGKLPTPDEPMSRDLGNPNQNRTMAAPDLFIMYPGDHRGWKALEDAITEIDNGL